MQDIEGGMQDIENYTNTLSDIERILCDIEGKQYDIQVFSLLKANKFSFICSSDVLYK